MKYLSVLMICLALISCQSKQKQSNVNQNKVQTQLSAMSIDQLMQQAAENVGKEVCFKGVVNHVCAHSGKRCIVKSEDGKLSIRVEATGNLEGFDREIAGNDIQVTGIIREKRLEASYIDEWEADLKTKQAAENGGETCSSEMANIKEMKEWMKKNDKDYYAIYYVDGSAYELIK